MEDFYRQFTEEKQYVENVSEATLEAYKWAWRSKEAGYRGGRMLLKMIYLEASAGGHNDYVEAYHWLTKAIAEDNGEYLASWRKRLEALMTPEQRNEVAAPASN